MFNTLDLVVDYFRVDLLMGLGVECCLLCCLELSGVVVIILGAYIFDP